MSAIASSDNDVVESFSPGFGGGRHQAFKPSNTSYGTGFGGQPLSYSHFNRGLQKTAEMVLSNESSFAAAHAVYNPVSAHKAPGVNINNA